MKRKFKYQVIVYGDFPITMVGEKDWMRYKSQFRDGKLFSTKKSAIDFARDLKWSFKFHGGLRDNIIKVVRLPDEKIVYRITR